MKNIIKFIGLVMLLIWADGLWGQEDRMNELTRNFEECPTETRIIIEKCNIDFIPTFSEGSPENDQFTIKARANDPNAKGRFKFTLYDISSLPGYCMNKPLNVPASGMHSDDWKDLQFMRPQANFNVAGQNWSTATTFSDDLNETEVTIQCYDFAAYGKIKVEFTPQGTNNVLLGVEEGSIDNQQFTRIPLDDNHNFIADGASQNNGLANDDNDNSPFGSGIHGDQITRFEEYRGFFLKNNYHRLSTDEKDIFIRNVNVTEAGESGFFTTSNLSTNVYVVNQGEYIESSRIITINHEDNIENPLLTELNATVIKIEAVADPVPTSSNVDRWGVACCGSSGTFTPEDLIYSFVYSNYISSGATLALDINSTNTLIFINTAVGFKPDGGKFRIGNEIIQYAQFNSSNSSFSGCIRGIDGSTAASHSSGSTVSYFSNPAEKIKDTFAHEAGHIINLEHKSNSDMNIMSVPSFAGSYLNNGVSNSFIGVSNTVLNTLQIKK